MADAVNVVLPEDTVATFDKRANGWPVSARDLRKRRVGFGERECESGLEFERLVGLENVDVGVAAGACHFAFEVFGVLLDRREGIVVLREGVVDVEPVDGDGGLLGPHCEVVADGDGGGVGLEVGADDVAHLGHERGVAGVIEGRRLAVGDLRRLRVRDDEPGRHAGVDVVLGHDPVRVVSTVHGDERVPTLDGAADVHPHPADGVLEAELLLTVRDEFRRRDQRRLRERAGVGDVVGVTVCQQHVIRRLDVRRLEVRLRVVEERVDQQLGVANGDVPRRVAVPGELHSVRTVG